jgi:hypothetical protein
LLLGEQGLRRGNGNLLITDGTGCGGRIRSDIQIKERAMSRKSTLALVAVLGLAAITPTATSARGLGGAGVVNFGTAQCYWGHD